MKRIFLIISFLLASMSYLSAQDIFNTILEDSKKVMNDSTGNIYQAKIATFKYNALQYIKKKSFEQEGDVTKKFLDDQAYFMNELVTTFFSAALLNTSLSKSEKKARIMSFIDASGSNPLFNDPDKELVNAYVENSKGQLTPFSLDTDWVKAYSAVRSLLELQDKKK